MPELGRACMGWDGGMAKPMMKLSGGIPVPHLLAAGWADWDSAGRSRTSSQGVGSAPVKGLPGKCNLVA